MSFKDLDIKLSYISCGEENIAKSFLIPTLKQAKSYKRSVGFFSSGVFDPIIDGIVALARNGGKIELIASPQLSEEDINAISLGYQKRDQIITDAFSRDFMKEIEALDDIKLQLLVELIANGTLDIKIAVTESAGIYHDKLGIIEDFDGNIVVFYGSPNESQGGYKNNYEKIRVVKSWVEAETDSVADECREFKSLWDGTNPFIKTYNYKESAKANILEVINTRKNASKNAGAAPIKLRDYQEQAINAWINNDYHGFYVMATGTGKTWTAIFSAKKLVEEHPAMIVICAPYKHLVKQWADDVEKAFPNAKLIMAFSENTSWDTQITQEIIRKQYTGTAGNIQHMNVFFDSAIIQNHGNKIFIPNHIRIPPRGTFIEKSNNFFLFHGFLLSINMRLFYPNCALISTPYEGYGQKSISIAFSATQKIVVSPPSSWQRPRCQRQLGFYFRISLTLRQKNCRPKAASLWFFVYTLDILFYLILLCTFVNIPTGCSRMHMDSPTV